jgi:hypothetical protein
LVDADFLDTKAFMEPVKGGQRDMEATALAAMLEQFDAHMVDKTAQA